MSEFRVNEIFPVSFLDNPYVVGRADGDFSVGEQVELRKKDGATYRGVLETLHIRQPEPGVFAFVFSENISSHVEPGDIIYSTESSS